MVNTISKIISSISNLEVGNRISLISVLISVFCAVFSFLQARSANDSYKLQQKVYNDGKVNFDFRILENFLVDNKESSNIYYFFGIQIFNISDKPTSIKNYELQLVCSDLVFKPKLFLDKLESYDALKQLPLSQDINAHSSVAGWCIFVLPKENHLKLDINSHVLVIEDIHNEKARQTSVLVREEVINYEIK